MIKDDQIYNIINIMKDNQSKKKKTKNYLKFNFIPSNAVSSVTYYFGHLYSIFRHIEIILFTCAEYN